MKRYLVLVAALLCGGATVQLGPTPATDNFDGIARDYVRQTLEIGEHDPGFVDAYYGPPEYLAAAKAGLRNITQLRAATEALLMRLETLRLGDPLDERRRSFLRGQLIAERTRLRMLAGEKSSFIQEARGLFGAVPDIKPLSAYSPVLARIAVLVPGNGSLADRVDAYEDRFNIPGSRIKPVMQAAIAECRRRTLKHISLPANERFELELVTGKPWGGYNYYQGDAHSKIEINTDLPIRIGRAIDLGCHEGYPGHHVYNALLEKNLARERGWAEFSVYPLYSPESLIAEGSANYGIELAFPDDEQGTFERAILYPLAGLPAAEADRYLALAKARRDLAGVRFTIVADYLDGKIDRTQAVQLTQQYQLESKARAEKSMEFADRYRSYIINYGLGLDMVRAYVEAAGLTQQVRWNRMERLLSEPTTPADLLSRSSPPPVTQ